MLLPVRERSPDRSAASVKVVRQVRWDFTPGGTSGSATAAALPFFVLQSHRKEELPAGSLNPSWVTHFGPGSSAKPDVGAKNIPILPTRV